jgi:hypothetical protein
VLEAAGAYAIGPLLVFLDLLKGDAEGLAQLLLTHSKHHTAEANPTADMDVDRVRLLLVSHCGSLSVAA